MPSIKVVWDRGRELDAETDSLLPGQLINLYAVVASTTDPPVNAERDREGDDKGRLVSIQSQPTVNTLRPIAGRDVPACPSHVLQ